MIDFNEFKKDIEKGKSEAKIMAYFNLYITQLPEDERPYKVDRVMVEGAKYILDRMEGKPSQKNILENSKDNPILFMPLEIMKKNNIKYDNRTTQSPDRDSEGHAQVQSS